MVFNTSISTGLAAATGISCDGETTIPFPSRSDSSPNSPPRISQRGEFDLNAKTLTSDYNGDMAWAPGERVVKVKVIRLP
jgi:hypothetical protein